MEASIMYFYPNYDCRDEVSEMITDLSPYTYPKNYQKGLNLIRNTLDSERKDKLFYNYLVSIAPTDEASQIVSSICDDEIKHNKMFRTIYYQLTGQVLPHGEDEQFDKPQSYCEGLKQALKGELAAVQRYRQILFAMKTPVHINMMTEIITDELRHSGLYNLLMTLGDCY